MTELPLLINVAAYSAQVLCIVAVGGLLSAVLRINTPAVRHACWRALVVVCVGLPWMQGRQVSTIDTSVVAELVLLPVPGADSSATPAALAAASSPAALSVTPGPSWPQAVLVLLATGAALRLLWLAVGLTRLARLRQAGHATVLSESEEALRVAIAPRASVRDVPALRQPVTFGLLRPVVLLPESLRRCDPDIRRAVLCHELHHARRADWASVVMEELVLCGLWFHPAAWWLVSRVQLSREELVDALVVRTTATRRTYIEALMLFSGEPGVAPAPAFSRRQHLFRRIVLLAKEPHMSIPRLLSSLCVLATAIGAGIWYAADAFPLSAAAADLPRVVATAPVVSPAPLTIALAMPTEAPRTPDDAPLVDMKPPVAQSSAPAAGQPPLPRQTVRIPVDNPPEMTAINATGVVVIRLTVDASGQVVDPHVVGYGISGADPAKKYRWAQSDPLPPVDTVFPGEPAWQAAVGAMNRAALDAARQFRYERPPAQMPGVYAAVMVPSPDGFVLMSPNQIGLPRTDPSALATTGGAGIGAVASADSPFTIDSELKARGAQAGAPGRSGGSQQAPGGAPGPTAAGIAAGTSSPSIAVAPPLPPPPPLRTPIRVGGNIPPPKKTRDVKPAYPAIAQSARVQGIVIIEVTISEAGKVVDARVLRSIPLLDGAALEAVRQWEFTPTLLNGQPVSIIMSVTVNFDLGISEPPVVP